MPYEHGPKFDAESRARLMGLESGGERAPTWRGWLLGVLSCVFLAAVIPYVDLIVRCTRVTLNLLPATSLVLLLVLILVFNVALGRWRDALRLSRQDLALVFCMTMLMNSIPGVGFMNYLVNAHMGMSYFTTPENNWRKTLYPHIPPTLTARDPYAVEPVQLCAGADVGGSYDPQGGAEKTGAFSSARTLLDGVRAEDNWRVLLAGQTDPRQNGVYVVVSSGAGRLERSADADTDAEVNWGLYATVKKGQARTGQGYWLVTRPPVRLNVSPLRFERFSSEAELPRPCEWFYSGLPPTGKSGWTIFSTLTGLLAPSYLRWYLLVAFVFGMFFAASALLHRQWSDRERLPFPLAQVPRTMMEGVFEGEGGRPLLLDKLTWIGIAVTFGLHSWNALGDYATNWAPIPIKNDMKAYLTEPPWSYLRPLHCHIFPSAIAFMYFVSLEVSFSLWFFYLVIFKIGVAIASGIFGLGEDGWYFNSGDGTRGIFINQATGALLVMAIGGLIMARGALFSSLRQALGLRPRDRHETFSPRLTWLALAGCVAGAVVWMVYYGITWYWAALLVLFLLVVGIGVARVVSEGGVLYAKGPGPDALLETVFTPVQLGTGNFLLAGMCGRLISFDSFRMNPLTNILGALHLGALARLKPRLLFVGLAVSLVITFTVASFSYHYVCYTNPGGARFLGWAFTSWVNGYYTGQAGQAGRIEAYRNKSAELAKAGRQMPASEVPPVARTDWTRITWLGVGVGLMSLFMVVRTRIFWWPHPIGYAMWVNMQAIYQMWFSYFVGWLLKALVLKFGGQRAFLNGRRFFVGLILGECLSTIFWIIVAWLTGTSGGYAIEIN